MNDNFTYEAHFVIKIKWITKLTEFWNMELKFYTGTEIMSRMAYSSAYNYSKQSDTGHPVTVV